MLFFTSENESLAASDTPSCYLHARSCSSSFARWFVVKDDIL